MLFSPQFLPSLHHVFSSFPTDYLISGEDRIWVLLKMQAFRSSSGSSGMQQKPSPSATDPRSPSPIKRRDPCVSSGSVDSKPSKLTMRKPSPMSRSFQEKQRTRPVSEMQQEWGQLRDELRRAKEGRSRALEELAELMKKNEKSTQDNNRIEMLEVEAEKAKKSEMEMLESLFSQTKQLEETKMLLEEAKLEIRNLLESKGNVSSSLSGHHLENGSLASPPAQEEIRKLRNELRLALEAEEKGKKAMDDLAIALHEVTSEANQANLELSVTKSDLEKARAEAEETNSSLLSTERRLQEVLNEYDKLKLDQEESAAAWKAKEESFMNCIKISEEDMKKLDLENSRLADANRVTREDNSKLRDIMKQAVSEATVTKDSLEIARNENYELKNQLFSKDAALPQIRQDYESLKVSEAAALDSVRELKSLLASVSTANPKTQSTETIDDRKIGKSTWKFTSDRWKIESPPVQNGHRHSVAAESDIYLKCLAFDRGGALDKKDATFRDVCNAPENRLLSSSFRDGKMINANRVEHLDGKRLQSKEIEKPKKKKNVFGRFGDVLRRRSFLKL